ncbi:MAG: hypothetical protein AAF203_01065 [Pseudomonadota bacterium]
MKSIAIFLITVLMSATGFAGDFYVLEMDNIQMKAGQGDDTIRIKRLMRQQHSGVDVRSSDLLSVMMVAKTRRGRGSAQLVVGQGSSAAENFGGTPADFQSHGETTFDRHLFVNKGDSAGKWQMKLKGNFIVSQIVVEIGDAGQDLVLNYNHVHMKGQGNVLALKNKANQQHAMALGQYDLEAVTLVAKTRQGRGTAQLRVGGEFSALETVGGQPGSFQNDSQWTYETITIENPSLSSQGAWQIITNGNFKVDQVVLHIRKK